MPSIESNQLLLAAAEAADSKKAEDLRILALDPSESGLTDYFLICNGTNERQNEAISDEIELRLKREFGTYPNSVEGRRQAEWILMDYVDFIVHIFSPEKRAHYGLERLRKSAKSISIDDLDAELKAMVAATRAKAPRKTASSGKAPASGRQSKPALKKSVSSTGKAAKATSSRGVKKTAGAAAAPRRPAKKAAKKLASKSAKSRVRS